VAAGKLLGAVSFSGLDIAHILSQKNIHLARGICIFNSIDSPLKIKSNRQKHFLI
jgi:hypothetical protein